VKEKGVAFLVKREKKWDPLKVVPVEMREENITRNRSVAEFAEQALYRRCLDPVGS
jgi:hypothetical protein